MENLVRNLKIFVILWLGTLAFSTPAICNTKSMARSASLSNAADAMQKKIEREKDAAKRAVQWCSLGAIQFLMGEQAAAESSFRQGLAIDPNVNFDFSMIKDAGVRKLWHKTKREVAKASDLNLFENDEDETELQDLKRVASISYSPNLREGERRERTLSKYGRTTSTMDYVMAAMPLGLGQFNNGNHWLGSALFVTQGVMAAYVHQLTNRAADFESRRGLGLDLLKTQGADPDSVERYSSESKSYLTELKQRTNVGLAALGTLWAIGSVEAIWTLKVQEQDRSRFLFGFTGEGPAFAFRQDF